MLRVSKVNSRDIIVEVVTWTLPVWLVFDWWEKPRNLANIYLLKFNKRHTRKRCEICSKLTVKTRQWRRSGVFIVNIEHISYLFLVFLLLTLNK